MRSICDSIIIILALSLSVANSQAQVPRVISYQGLVVDQTNTPLTGTHTMVVGIWDAGSSGGTLIYQETHQGILFSRGVFDLFIGSQNSPVHGLPRDLTFGVPYWIQITIDPGTSAEIRFPRQQLTSSPYALNAERVNGIFVSPTPVQGDTTIFPIPIDAFGKIDKSILPAPTLGVETINTVAPDGNGAMSFIGNGIAITPNLANHTIELKLDPPSAGTGATMVAVGTTAQRPQTPTAGMIRFNTTTAKFEGFDGSSWVDLN